MIISSTFIQSPITIHTTDVFQIGFAIVTNNDNNVNLMLRFTVRIDDQSTTGNDSFNSELRFT